MALDFGQHPDVVFERAPLENVLTQVKFTPILSLMTLAGVVGFQTAIKDAYPSSVPVARTTFVAAGDVPDPSKSKAPVWRFRDTDERWTVGLSADFVSLETASYSDIGEFLSRFEFVLEALRRVLRPVQATRIGLRKVNRVELDGTTETRDLARVVRSEMLGILAVEKFPAPISGMVSQLQFKDGDNLMVVNFGLDPSVARDKLSFVLDVDYSTQQRRSLADIKEIVDLLRYYSEGSTSFFHWALNDQFKESLGPRPRMKESTR